jgi:hydroxymethylbilane synthase
MKRLRPDVTIALMRGNVQTRLRKLADGEADATLLAIAGLKRLGMPERATAVLETDDFLPAVGQGAVGLTARGDDARTLDVLAPILDRQTGTALAVERAFLRVLDGSCRTPLAGLARVEGDRVRFRGMILRPDGGDFREVSDEGAAVEADALGQRAAHALREASPAELLAYF